MSEVIHIDYKALYEKERAANALMQETIEILRHELAQLKKIVFGSKSERFVPTDDSKVSLQLSLGLDAETIATCKITATTKVSYERTKTEVIPHPPKAHPGRMKLPDHLPLHRQLQRYQRAGVTIAQTTINDWVKVVLINLTALYELHKQCVLSTGYLHTDETTLKVLDENKKGSSHQG